MMFIIFFSSACAAQSPLPGKFHHTSNGFRNVYEQEERGAFDFLKWRLERLFKSIPSPESYQFSLAENDPASLKSGRKNTVTWIGHATVLLQLDGMNILTDPHFSERASPVQWAGPKRVVRPGIPMEALPNIDMVFISHDHYDSLDKQTIRDLHKRPGGEETLFFVPLGLKHWFEQIGIERVIEMDWWDNHEEDGFTVTAVPVHHWSKRTPFSRNTTLWAGWIVQSGDFRFFFVGDTGYSPILKEIGDRFGKFDLAAIPIGAYEPRWFMRSHHINPEEAVQVHLDIRSRQSIAIHWGTFILTDEPLDEPPVRLEKALQEKGIPKEAFRVLQHGETMILN
jgi:N-acyl-phosphatidylethanolamine-hydrolysing phospholipase D